MPWLVASKMSPLGRKCPKRTAQAIEPNSHVSGTRYGPRFIPTTLRLRRPSGTLDCFVAGRLRRAQARHGLVPRLPARERRRPRRSPMPKIPLFWCNRHEAYHPKPTLSTLMAMMVVYLNENGNGVLKNPRCNITLEIIVNQIPHIF